MAVSTLPLKIVPPSTLAYYALSQFVLKHAKGSTQAKLKAISAGHATASTILVLYALSLSPLRSQDATKKLQPAVFTSSGNLDDSENPLIQAQSKLANALTAWETGYLLYDTWAMAKYAPTDASVPRSFTQYLIDISHDDPVVFGHHVALSAAMLYLQYYIYNGRERGMWIIVTLLLMNASSPLLHLRNYLRQHGKRSASLDVAFAVLFALARFASVAWILGRYGAHHGLTSIQAYKLLRLPCQAGTGALVGLNGLWWLNLVRGIAKRALRGR
jgi:hypothetical protein